MLGSKKQSVRPGHHWRCLALRGKQGPGKVFAVALVHVDIGVAFFSIRGNCQPRAGWNSSDMHQDKGTKSQELSTNLSPRI
jgi:hypothetical protein